MAPWQPWADGDAGWASVLNRRVVWALLCCLWLSTANALQWAPADGKVDLLAVATYVEDVEGTLSVEQLVQHPTAYHFKPAPADFVNFGFADHPYWFRFRLGLREGTPSPAVLYLINALLDEAELYVVDASGAVRQIARVGDTLPYFSRPIAATSFAIPLALKTGPEHDYYLRISGRSQVRFSLELHSYEGFSSQLASSEWQFGIMAGLVLAVVGVASVLFLISRRLVYAYFVIYAAGTELAILVGLGYGFRWWPEAVLFQQKAIFIGLGLSSLCYALFLRELLETARYAPRLDTFLKFSIGLYVINLIWLPFGSIKSITESYYAISLFLLCPQILAAMYIRVKGRDPIGWLLVVPVLLNVSLNFQLAIPGLQQTLRFDTALRLYQVAELLDIVLFGACISVQFWRQMKRNEEIERLALEAELKSRFKSEFLARMSHEIRTPINGVLGTAELMADTALDSRQQRYLEIINSSGHALLGVINDILDYSKIEAGKMSLEHIPFNLPELLAEVRDIFLAKAQESHVELVIDVDASLPEQLRGDPTRLRQVLVNLVSNAFKYTRKGEVVLRVGMAGEQLRFSVTDTGTGISLENQRKLFSSFEQLGVATARQYGGTGLGLAICKQLVVLMGGEIGVNSQLGAGSEFWFTLPFAVADTAPVVVRSLAGLNMLLVEDNATARDVLARHGRACGMAVDAASSFKEALALLGAHASRYDLIILDLHLGDGTGMALRELIRHEFGELQLPFVLVTATGLLPAPSELAALGFSFAANKPATVMEFRKMAERALQKGACKRTLGRDESAVPQDQALRVLVAEDNDVNWMVTRGLLEKLGHNAQRAQDGEQALAMLQGEHGFDLVLMDCEMPTLDGLAATRAYRAGEQVGHLPIIALTAHAVESQRRQCLEAGMDGCLVKPVSRQTLREALQDVQLIRR